MTPTDPTPRDLATTAAIQARREAVRLYEFLHHLPGCAAGYLWATEPAYQCDCGLFDAIRVVGLNQRTQRQRDLEKARAEGRQQAVRGIRAEFAHCDWSDEIEYRRLSRVLDRVEGDEPDFSRCCGNYLESGECCAAVNGVAGLNASESPPTHTHKVNAGCFPSCPAHYSRDASESPPHQHHYEVAMVAPFTEDPGKIVGYKCECGHIIERDASESPPPEYGWHNDGDECIGPHCINMEHDDERDASESGQPPEGASGE